MPHAARSPSNQTMAEVIAPLIPAEDAAPAHSNLTLAATRLGRLVDALAQSRLCFVEGVLFALVVWQLLCVFVCVIVVFRLWLFVCCCVVGSRCCLDVGRRRLAPERLRVQDVRCVVVAISGPLALRHVGFCGIILRLIKIRVL